MKFFKVVVFLLVSVFTLKSQDTLHVYYVHADSVGYVFRITSTNIANDYKTCVDQIYAKVSAPEMIIIDRKRLSFSSLSIKKRLLKN